MVSDDPHVSLGSSRTSYYDKELIVVDTGRLPSPFMQAKALEAGLSSDERTCDPMYLQFSGTPNSWV